MTKYYEVIRQTLDLADTCEESLRHIPTLFAKGEFESAIRLYRDFVEAYYEMEKSLDQIKEDVDVIDLATYSDEVREAMQKVLHFIESQDFQEARMSLEKGLTPTYQRWQAAMVKTLQPHILS